MLSVIIPTNNSERFLVPTLSALVPGAVDGVVSEVIIADAGSTDGTPAIADAAGCVVARAASVACGLRDAAVQARRPWLLFLRPGFVPDQGWADEVRHFIATVQGAADTGAATFRTDSTGPRPAAREIFALIGARFFAALNPDRGLLIAKRSYEALGGHREGIKDPESDLMRQIGRRRITTLRCGGTLLSTG
jgi:glycosyltransferase involved in cell wall biosynthesis